eukprot:560920-Rhodomonas_salina.2
MCRPRARPTATGAAISATNKSGSSVYVWTIDHTSTLCQRQLSKGRARTSNLKVPFNHVSALRFRPLDAEHRVAAQYLEEADIDLGKLLSVDLGIKVCNEPHTVRYKGIQVGQGFNRHVQPLVHPGVGCVG